MINNRWGFLTLDIEFKTASTTFSMAGFPVRYDFDNRIFSESAHGLYQNRIIKLSELLEGIYLEKFDLLPCLAKDISFSPRIFEK